MKYLVIGAGGTGGPLGAYLARGKKDVTLIARGEHLKNIQRFGLCIQQTYDQQQWSVNLPATDMDGYKDQADVIFVCVKGYSLKDTVPFIRRVCHKDTVVIPILNIYGTGGWLQTQLEDVLVTDGCIYVSANIKEPGVISMHGSIFRIVYGVRNREENAPILRQVKADLDSCGISGEISEDIRRDALQKFSYVSCMAAAGLYYDAKADRFQRPGPEREMFVALMKEIEALAGAMGIVFETDIVKTNLEILDALAPTASTSMQRDIEAGRQSEVDGLIYEVLRMGEKYGVPLPEYEKAAKKAVWTVKKG